MPRFELKSGGVSGLTAPLTRIAFTERFERRLHSG
jgi:hypothetical protein